MPKLKKNIKLSIYFLKNQIVKKEYISRKWNIFKKSTLLSFNTIYEKIFPNYEKVFPELKTNFQDQFENLIHEFQKKYPFRKDKLTIEDLKYYEPSIHIWQKIASHYDILQCYSTDPIWAMMGNLKPYVAFEHGTLRDFTMGNTMVHRLTSLAYRKADHVFITNGDCLEYAEKLGIQNYSPMLHPIEVQQSNLNVDTSEKVKKLYNADVLLFCPIRHDWEVKGTHIHLYALPKICAELPGRTVLLLVNWGKEVERSRQLVEDLGLSNNVIWLKPLCRKQLIKFMYACDVVLDQMALPHFGATAPQALALGIPVIMSYKPESTAWIINEPAPIITAITPDEVVTGVVQALDPIWKQSFKERALHWFSTQHHPNKIVSEHLRVYRKLMEEKYEEQL